ncbi:MAG: SDR family oxidoreductase [Bacteroidota bacterium]
MKGLKGKSAIVTGGGAGIGKACVERLCQEGVSVTFSDMDEKNAAETLENMRKKGYQIQAIIGDMCEEDFCKKLVEAASNQWGNLHFLVNNAFSFISKGMDSTQKDWERIMNVGPVAFAHMVRYAAPHMRQAGSGAVVNVSSISAHIVQPNRWTYNSAKAAVSHLTRCMAFDLAPDIRVNAVSPAWIWTQEVEKVAVGERDKWEPIWADFHPMNRIGRAEEVAGPIAFLLSEEASFITGTDLFIDGGYLTMGAEGKGHNSSFVGSE